MRAAEARGRRREANGCASWMRARPLAAGSRCCCLLCCLAAAGVLAEARCDLEEGCMRSRWGAVGDVAREQAPCAPNFGCELASLHAEEAGLDWAQSCAAKVLAKLARAAPTVNHACAARFPRGC